MRIEKECHVKEIEHCSFKVKKICCRKMKKALNSDSVLHFSDGSGDFERIIRFNKGVFQIPLAIDDNFGYTWFRNWVEIFYCPWCGERID